MDSGEQPFCEQRFIPLELIKIPARPFSGRGGRHPVAVQRTAAETLGTSVGRLALRWSHSFALVSAVPAVLCGIGGALSPLSHTASLYRSILTRLQVGGAPDRSL